MHKMVDFQLVVPLVTGTFQVTSQPETTGPGYSTDYVTPELQPAQVRNLKTMEAGFHPQS
jgi:hypothetical protein